MDMFCPEDLAAAFNETAMDGGSRCAALMGEDAAQGFILSFAGVRGGEAFYESRNEHLRIIASYSSRPDVSDRADRVAFAADTSLDDAALCCLRDMLTRTLRAFDDNVDIDALPVMVERAWKGGGIWKQEVNGYVLVAMTDRDSYTDDTLYLLGLIRSR